MAVRASGLADAPLRGEELLAAVAHPSCGGDCLFLGVVRDRHEGRAVRAVTYDAFRPLAEKVLAELAAEAARRWGARVALFHRLGRLEVGEAGLAAAAAAEHRAEAFEACRWLVDEAKRRLPVWKKEHYADGDSAWLAGCSLEPAEAAAP